MKVVVAALVLMLAGSDMFGREPSPEDRKAIQIISGYVLEQRGWAEKEYRIEKQQRDGSQQIYTVVYIPDVLWAKYPGAGKSFAVVYDPRSHRVTHELKFQ